MFHKHRLIISILLLSGCVKDRVLPQDLKVEFEEDRSREIRLVEKSRKQLEEPWYKDADINVNKNVPLLEYLRSIAKTLGIKLQISVDEGKNINYSAKKKSFFEILRDICAQNGWKLTINGLNAKISPDIPYIHTHQVPYLLQSRKTQTETSAGSINEKENFSIGSSAKIENTSTLDAFEELQKNLENILSNYETEGEKKLKFTIHKQAGTVTLFATQRIHRIINNYINLITKNMRNQVLIEARIFEVGLYEGLETGIDWSRIFARGLDNDIPISAADNSTPGAISLALVNKTPIGSPPTWPKITGTILTLLKTFGKVQSISNPRIIVANNQVGIFKVVDNKVFFRLKQKIMQSSNIVLGSAQPTNTDIITSEAHTIPVGIIILVQPSIDESGRITIALRPTISEVDHEVEDPAVVLMAQKNNLNVSSKIPVIKSRELDTVFTVEEDVPVIIGGLLYSKKSERESGLPNFGWLQGSKKRASEKKEIVILMKAKLIKNFEDDYEKMFKSVD